MMSGMALRMLGFAALLACGAFGATGTVVTTEELFRWGEYDSLIRALEPLIQTPGFATRAADRADSSERARSLLYLGVAYFAKGRTDRADTAFRFACALDPGVELDKFYVTPAIAGHFDAVRTESRRGSLEREALARAVRSAPAAAPAPSGRRQADRKVLKEDPRWVWWGLGTAALVAAGGGAYWYAQQASGPREIVTTLDVRGNR